MTRIFIHFFSILVYIQVIVVVNIYTMSSKHNSKGHKIYISLDLLRMM